MRPERGGGEAWKSFVQSRRAPSLGGNPVIDGKGGGAFHLVKRRGLAGRELFHGLLRFNEQKNDDDKPLAS